MKIKNSMMLVTLALLGACGASVKSGDGNSGGGDAGKSVGPDSDGSVYIVCDGETMDVVANLGKVDLAANQLGSVTVKYRGSVTTDDAYLSYTAATPTIDNDTSSEPATKGVHLNGPQGEVFDVYTQDNATGLGHFKAANGKQEDMVCKLGASSTVPPRSGASTEPTDTSTPPAPTVIAPVASTGRATAHYLSCKGNDEYYMDFSKVDFAAGFPQYHEMRVGFLPAGWVGTWQPFEIYQTVSVSSSGWGDYRSLTIEVQNAAGVAKTFTLQTQDYIHAHLEGGKSPMECEFLENNIYAGQLGW